MALNCVNDQIEMQGETQKEPQPTNSLRWSGKDKRDFLEHLAATGNVTKAASSVGKSLQSAYMQRHRREGRGFAYGWQAAILLARVCLTDILMIRALEGQEEFLIRDAYDGSMARTRYDNKLSIAMLTRLDNMATNENASVDTTIAQLVMLEFDTFLDVIENGNSDATNSYINLIQSPLHSAQISSVGFDENNYQLARFSANNSESLPLIDRCSDSVSDI